MDIETLMEHPDEAVRLAAEDLRAQVRRREQRAGQPEFRIAKRLYRQGWSTHHHNVKQEPRPPVHTFHLCQEKREALVRQQGRYMGIDGECLEFVRAVWAALFTLENLALTDLRPHSLEWIFDYLEDLDKEAHIGDLWHTTVPEPW